MDKKLTDSETVKALECCGGELHFCSKCPMYKQNPNNDYCREDMNKQALDLINRLQEEKEALINGQETLQKYIADLQAENDRLSQFGGILLHNGSELFKELQTAKAEAYKEFAERYKTLLETELHWCECADEIIKQIDNLLKELVGEDNESKNKQQPT